jgi:hypothetical protein
MDRIPAVAQFVLEVAKDAYPGRPLTDVPYHSRWRHFEPAGIDRLAAVRQSGRWPQDPAECVRSMLDLAVVSVLLDAGAGHKWVFCEPETGVRMGRSEGLGLASWHMFLAGKFSSDPVHHPLRADAEGLLALSAADLKAGFQVDEQTNPLVGFEGRLTLLHNLGRVLATEERFFSKNSAPGARRPGYMYDYLLDCASQNGKITIHDLWRVVSEGFANVWPGTRTSMDGINLGDAWRLPALERAHGPDASIVTFHKLSQWMTYSLLEPLEQEARLQLEGAAQHMTGLAEYRNGGLFVDMGVIVPKNPAELAVAHNVDEPFVVEWRALTVSLLDHVAAEIRKLQGGVSVEQLPLAKVLEAGTWKAGRVVARKLRPETGDPPVRIISDGTVF